MVFNGLRLLAFRIRQDGTVGRHSRSPRRPRHRAMAPETLEIRTLLSATAISPPELAINSSAATSHPVAPLSLMVSQDITGAEHWTLADSPITLTRNISIASTGSLTIDQGVTVNGGGYTLFVNSGGTLDASSGGVHFNLDIDAQGKATFTSDFFDSGILHVRDGSNVTVTGNSFHGGSTQDASPLHVAPGFVPNLTGNTFTDPGTYIVLLPGQISANTTWKKFTNVSGYRILDGWNPNSVDTVYVNSGATLTIEPGNHLLTTDGYLHDGIVVNTGGKFVMNSLDPNLVSTLTMSLFADSGANLSLQGNHVQGYVTASGTGSILNNVFEGAAQLTVTTNTGVTVTGNSFHGGSTQDASPLHVAPGFVPNLTGNTFTDPGTYIVLLPGQISANTTWKKFTNVSGYRILDGWNPNSVDTVYVNSGATLTIEPGNHLLTTDGYLHDGIVVDGTLNAQGVLVGMPLTLKTNSQGTIYENTFDIPFSLTTKNTGGSDVQFRFNDFSSLTSSDKIGIYYGGGTGGTVDLSKNFWGDPATALSKIYNDSPANISVNTSKPVPQGSIGEKVWNDLNGNGIQDPAEPGIANVTVEARDASNTNNILATTLSDSDGDYLLTLPSTAPGQQIYLALANAPSGFTPAQAGQGNPWTGSDFNPTMLKTAPFQWTAENVTGFDPRFDAGLIPSTGNHAPTLNAAGTPSLTAIPNNLTDATNPGTSITQLIANLTGTGGAISDPDLGALTGIAITSADQTHGTWQFSINGGSSWTNLGTPTASAAQLLASDANTLLRFKPNAGFVGNATFLFVAWDQTTGVNGGTAAATNRGGSKAFSTAYDTAVIKVFAANSAPVLDPAGIPTVYAILEDTQDANNPGTSVAQLIANMTNTGGSITDSDAGALRGIAVTVMDQSHGTWQYTTNSGTQWLDFGTTSAAQARLLAATAATRVRFRPNPNYNGTATFVFVAWDQTSGTNGGTASVTSRGGNKAFSLGYDTASITVTSVNDAPVLNPAGTPTLTPISNAIPSANNTGMSISQLITSLTNTGGSITDVDAGALKGIAITSADQSHGTWQYTINNGTTWINFGTPSASDARLLAASASTKVRFQPNAGFVGTAGFVFVAWDQSLGTNGGTAVATNRGGNKPFSLAFDTASISITA